MIKTKIYNIPIEVVNSSLLSNVGSVGCICASIISSSGELFDIDIDATRVVPVEYCEEYDTSHAFSHSEFIEECHKLVGGWLLSLQMRCDWVNEYFVRDDVLWDYNQAILDLEKKRIVETRKSECLWPENSLEFRFMDWLVCKEVGCVEYRTVSSLDGVFRPKIREKVEELWIKSQQD